MLSCLRNTSISLTILIVLAFSSVTCAESNPKEYTFAIVPQLTPLETSRRWTPVVDAIQKLTGLKLKLVHYPSIPIFESRLARGEPDIAYMNPYHAIQAKQQEGYIPIIRDGNKLLKGILVVRNDSGITNPEDLKGAKVAFPAPNAFGASLYMRALLDKKFKLQFQNHYVKTHANVYRNVIYRSADAGGGVARTLNMEKPAVRKLLRIIYTTPGVPAHPISVHPSVSQETLQTLSSVFISMSKDPAYKSLLTAIGIPDPIQADYVRDYAPLLDLELEKYLNAGSG